MAAKKPVKMKARKTTVRAKATKKASPRSIRQAKSMGDQEVLRVEEVE
jgi:BRCT domain type II-containing protein